MSGLVLAVGALMVAAGAYEMYAGSGDILSERGWSAFIAGSVFIAAGFATMALGLAIRAIDALRRVMLGQQATLPSTVPLPERIEPGIPLTPPLVVAPEPHRDPHDGPLLEAAPTAPVLAAAPIEHAPVEHALVEETEPAAIEAPAAPEHDVPGHDVPPAPSHGHQDDWLDHSFAELERETARHQATVASSPEPHPDAHGGEIGKASEIAHEPAPPVPADAGHEHVAEPAPHHDAAPKPESEPEPTNGATVSAREEPARPASAVIGRYESEGTSYVMYADGSIDAQSEAGVYRFASMAELKTFIES